MKKMLTKMLAVAMAWAMLLSCTVMASAGSVTPEGETPQSGIGGEGKLVQGWGVTANTDEGRASLQVNSAGYRNYASGEARGVSHNEGKLPSDVIRLLMPVVGSSALDMILDPHNLINATNAARYGGSSGADFMEGTQLYFLNVYSGGRAYYTNESQKLTITNKSSVPVDVNLSLRVNKGSGIDSSAFKFVSTSTGLASTTGATMYLALMSGDDAKPLEKPVVESGNLGMHSWAYNNVRFLPAIGSGAALLGHISSDAVLSSGVLQFLTSDASVRQAIMGAVPMATIEVLRAASSGTWDTANINANAPIEWTAGFPNGTEKNDTSDSTLVTGQSEHPHSQGISIYSNGNIIRITATAPDVKDSNSNPLYVAVVKPDSLTSYNPAHKDTGFVLNTTIETPVSIVYYKASDTAYENPVAALYFNLKANSLSTTEVGTKSEIKLIASDGNMPIAATAFIKGSIDEAENAYTYAYNSAAGYYQVFREENEAEFLKYAERGIGSAKYDSLSFWLKGAIGGVDKYWDTIGGDIGISLIWDVYASKQVILSGNKPNIAVTTKPTSTQNKTLKLTWTPGTLDYESYLPDTVITLNTGTTLTMIRDVNQKTLVNSSAWTTISPTAVKTATVVFKADGKKDLKITVAVK